MSTVPALALAACTVHEMCQALGLEQAHALAVSSGLQSLTVRWNGRLRTSAGRMSYKATTPTGIELSPKLVPLGLAEVVNTFLHELGHALALHRDGYTGGHGAPWRRACRELGLAEPTRYHSHGWRGERKAVARCERCGYVLRRHRALPRRSIWTRWTHKTCGGTLIRLKSR